MDQQTNNNNNASTQMIYALIIAQVCSLFSSYANAIIGFVIDSIKSIIVYIRDYLHGKIYTTIMIEDQFFIYGYFKDLISDNHKKAKTNLSLQGKYAYDIMDSGSEWFNNIVFKKLHNGSFFITKFEGKYIWIKYPLNMIGWCNIGKESESEKDKRIIQLITLTNKSTEDFFRRFITTISQKYKFVNIDSTTIIVNTWIADKCKFEDSIVHKRDLDSVFIQRNAKDSLLKEVKKFRESEKFYHDRGISYQRGFLLHGPPGTGKSSFVKAVASKFNLTVYLVDLNEISENGLVSIFKRAINTNPLILFEDIDKTGILDDVNNDSKCELKSQESKEAPKKKLSYAGFINALSGISNLNGAFFFITTNNYDKLPKSLTRPGRVDVILEITYADHEQIVMMTQSFYPDGNNHLIKNFADMLLEKCNKVTCAMLQSHFLTYDIFDEMVKNYDKILINR